mmetsp:Transcript_1029/g.2813  ORF Transcript_1029/g.2813 Transcript_1029/m.2813 type:complete len:97 (+) Transcript_1029:144-434(+)
MKDMGAVMLHAGADAVAALAACWVRAMLAVVHGKDQTPLAQGGATHSGGSTYTGSRNQRGAYAGARLLLRRQCCSVRFKSASLVLSRCFIALFVPF